MNVSNFSRHLPEVTAVQIIWNAVFDPPENVEKADVKNDYVGSEELTNIYCPIESATEDVSEFDD